MKRETSAPEGRSPEPARRAEQAPAAAPRTVRHAPQSPRGAVDPAGVLRLQRAVGNRAVRRLLAGDAPGHGFERGLADSRGGGAPLTEGTRAFMEARFGADFGDVRVHADSRAAHLNEAIGARAFTRGADIFIGGGGFDPASGASRRLLAHELTHVVQQTAPGRAPPIQTKLTFGPAGDAFEQQADRVADAVMGAPEPSPPAPGEPGGDPTIGRMLAQSRHWGAPSGIQRIIIEEVADDGVPPPPGPVPYVEEVDDDDAHGGQLVPFGAPVGPYIGGPPGMQIQELPDDADYDGPVVRPSRIEEVDEPGQLAIVAAHAQPQPRQVLADRLLQFLRQAAGVPVMRDLLRRPDVQNFVLNLFGQLGVGPIQRGRLDAPRALMGPNDAAPQLGLQLFLPLPGLQPPGLQPPRLAPAQGGQLVVHQGVALPAPVLAYFGAHRQNLQLAVWVITATGMNVALANLLMPSLLLNPPPGFAAILAVTNTVGRYPAHAALVLRAWSALRYNVAVAVQSLQDLYTNLNIVAAPQLAYAEQIFERSGYRIAPVRAWANAGQRLPAPRAGRVARAAAAAPVHVLGGAGPLLALHPLDHVLGAGAHAAIRNLIGVHNRAYAVNPFVVNHAQALLAAGANQADARAELATLTTNIANVADYNTAVTLAGRMFTAHVPLVEIQTFTVLPAAVAAANQAVLADLVTRGEVRSVRLAAVLGILAPLGGPARANLIANEFAPTQGLTLTRLLSRLQNFTGLVNQNIAIGNVAAEFVPVAQSIQNRVNAHTMSAAAAGWARAAFRLLNATRAQMLAFLGDNRVNGTFAQAQNGNAAFWLLQFARYHTGAPAPVAPQIVVINAGGANRNVHVTAWIVDHVQRRHTYEHYRLNEATITRGLNPPPSSTVFNAPTTGVGIRQMIANTLTSVAGAAIVVAAFPWNGAVPINIGAIQLRIAWDGVLGAYAVTQYYVAVAPGLGQVIPPDALRAIRERFPFLVY